MEEAGVGTSSQFHSNNGSSSRSNYAQLRGQAGDSFQKLSLITIGALREAQIYHSTDHIVQSEMLSGMQAEIQEVIDQLNIAQIENDDLNQINENYIRSLNAIKQVVDRWMNKLGVQINNWNTDTNNKLNTFDTVLNRLSGCLAEYSTERNELIEMIQHNQSQISDLRSQNSSLQKQNNNLQSKDSELNKKNSDLGNIVSNLQNQNTNYENEIEQLRSKVSEMEIKNIEIIEHNTKLQDEVSELTRANSDNQNKYHNSQTKITEYETEISNLRNQVLSLQNMNFTLNNEKSYLEKEKLEEKKSVSSLQLELSYLKNNNLDTQSKNLELQKTNEDLFNKTVDLERLNSELSEEIFSLKNKSSELQAKNAENEEEITKIRFQVSRLQEEVTNLQTLNSELKTSISNLKQENKQLQDDKLEIENINLELKDQVSNMGNEISNWSNQHNELQLENNELKNSKNELKKQFDDLSRANSGLINQIKKYNEEIEVLRSNSHNTHSEMKEKIIKLNNKLNDEKDLNVRLMEQISVLGQLQQDLEVAHQYEVQYKETEQLLNAEKSKNEELSQDHAEIIKICGQFNLEVFEINDHFQNIKTQNAQLTHNLKEAKQQIEEYKNNMKKLENANEVLDSQIQCFSTATHQKDEKREELYSQISELNNQIEQLKDENKRLSNDIENLLIVDQQRQSKISILSELNKELEEQSNQLAESTKLLMDNDTEYMKLKDEYNKINNHYQKLAQENSQNYALIASLNAKVESLDRQNKALKDENSATSSLIDEIERAKEVNEEYYAKIDEMENINNKLRQSLEESTARMNDVVMMNSSIQQNISQLTNDKIEAKSSLDKAIRFLNEIQQQVRAKSIDAIPESISSIVAQFSDYQSTNNNLMVENNKLNAKLTSKDQIISQLQESIKGKSEEISIMKTHKESSTNELKNEIIRLCAEINERRQREGQYQTIDNERNLMLEMIGKFEEHIFDQQQIISSKESELKEIYHINTELVEKANAKISELENYVHQLETVKVELDTQIQRLQKKLASVSESKENAEGVIEKLNAEKNIMNSRLRANEGLNSYIKKLEDDFNSISSDNETLKKQISQLTIENGVLEHNLAQQTTDRSAIKTLENEKIELESHISVLEAQLQLRLVKQKDAEINIYEKKCKEAEKKYESSLQELNETKSKLDTTIFEKDELTLQVEELQTERNALILSNEELQYHAEEAAELKSMREIYQNMVNERDRAVQKYEEINTEKNGLILNIDELEHNIEESNKQVQSLNQQIEDLMSSYDELQAKYKETQIHSTESETNNIQSKSQILKLKNQITELESRIQTLQYENEELKKEIIKKDEFHQKELDYFSEKIKTIHSDEDQEADNTDVVVVLNQRLAEATEKIQNTEAMLRNEMAEHLSTQQSMAKIQDAKSEISIENSRIQSEYKALLNAVTQRIKCEPQLAAIISKLSEIMNIVANSNSLNQKLRNTESELRKANEEPETLKYKLYKLESEYKIMEKSKILAEKKLQNAETPIVRLQSYSPIKEHVLSFLTKLTNVAVNDHARLLISQLYEKIVSGDYSSPQLWDQLAENLAAYDLTSIATFFREQIQKLLVNSGLDAITEKISPLQNQVNLMQKKVNLIYQKAQVAQKMARPLNLYERSIKPREITTPITRKPFVKRSALEIIDPSEFNYIVPNTERKPKRFVMRTDDISMRRTPMVEPVVTFGSHFK